MQNDEAIDSFGTIYGEIRTLDAECATNILPGAEAQLRQQYPHVPLWLLVGDRLLTEVVKLKTAPPTATEAALAGELREFIVCALPKRLTALGWSETAAFERSFAEWLGPFALGLARGQSVADVPRGVVDQIALRQLEQFISARAHAGDFGEVRAPQAWLQAETQYFRELRRAYDAVADAKHDGYLRDAVAHVPRSFELTPEEEREVARLETRYAAHYRPKLLDGSWPFNEAGQAALAGLITEASREMVFARRLADAHPWAATVLGYRHLEAKVKARFNELCGVSTRELLDVKGKTFEERVTAKELQLAEREQQLRERELKLAETAQTLQAGFERQRLDIEERKHAVKPVTFKRGPLVGG